MKRITILGVAALAVCLIWIGPRTQVLAQSSAKKIVNLVCAAGQTVIFDGVNWMCIDFPPGTGLSGLERVQVDSPLDFVATKEVRAECPADKKVLGGGYLFLFGGPTVPIRTNIPAIDLDSWVVSGTNLNGEDWSVSAVAICADAS
jgi:hypothetical protein